MNSTQFKIPKEKGKIEKNSRDSLHSITIKLIGNLINSYCFIILNEKNSDEWRLFGYKKLIKTNFQKCINVCNVFI